MVSAYDDKNINLLPGDVQKKRTHVLRAINQKPEYVQPAENKSEKKSLGKQLSLLVRSLLPGKKAKPVTNTAPQKNNTAHTEAATDLPDGAPLPSVMFENVPTIKKSVPLPVKKTEPVVVPKSVPIQTVSQSQPIVTPVKEKKPYVVPPQKVVEQKKPIISSLAKTTPIAPAKPLPVAPSALPEKKPVLLPQKNQLSWWKRLFFKKKKTNAYVVAPRLDMPAPLEKKAPPVAAIKTVATVPADTLKKQEEYTAKKPDTAPLEIATEKQHAPIKRQALFEVNLLTREYQRAFEQKNPTLIFGGSVGVTILVLALMYASLYLYATQNTSSYESLAAANQTLATAVSEYNTLSQKDIVLREQAVMIQTLLANHLSWTSFLGALESQTVPEVTYTTLTATAAGSVSITAVATNYTSLARQMTVFMNDTPWIETLSVDSAALLEQDGESNGSVEFDIDMKIKKEIFTD